MKLWACEIMGLDSIRGYRRRDARGISLAPPATRHCLMRKRSGLSPKGECFPFGGSVMEMTRREFAKGGLAALGYLALDGLPVFAAPLEGETPPTFFNAKIEEE